MNFQFQLREYKKQNGTQAIRLRFFTSAKDIQYVDTGISVLKTHWDSKKQIIKKHPLEESLNASLVALLNEIKILYYKNEGISAKRLLQIYKNSKKYNENSFFNFFEEVINEMTIKESFYSVQVYKAVFNKLKEFSSFLNFSDINPIWAKDYQQWAIKKGNKLNTANANLKVVKAVLNKAVRLEIIDKNPLRNYEMKYTNTSKDFLTYEEIKKIEKAVFPERNRNWSLARDVFLFSFFSAGMRFGDICKLKWENITENEIVYVMGKSIKRSGAKRFLPLNSKTLNILEKYKNSNSVFVFPMLNGLEKADKQRIVSRISSCNLDLNRALKKIAKFVFIEKNLSLHISKHSFADYAVKNNVDLLHISKLLGHTKLATTEHYLKDFYNKEQAEVMNKLFGE
ncbi:tyrosine-type recombinase/integrase [Capnocytophaga cynodegmi]|uniref:tyrosine-type recombinase/integrase n=1 Tax=Capnocytophaga cynodegmi TaxID=28189 RepID=UPI003858735F